MLALDMVAVRNDLWGPAKFAAMATRSSPRTADLPLLLMSEDLQCDQGGGVHHEPKQAADPRCRQGQLGPWPPLAKELKCPLVVKTAT